LRITAAGRWQIVVRDAAAAPTFSGTTSGHGDAVLTSLGPSGVATITHNGTSNFVVRATTSSAGQDLLVNEIGNYNGRQPWPTGPAFIQISADGDWTVKVGA
jgi:hypothetical protein